MYSSWKYRNYPTNCMVLCAVHHRTLRCRLKLALLSVQASCVFRPTRIRGIENSTWNCPSKKLCNTTWCQAGNQGPAPALISFSSAVTLALSTFSVRSYDPERTHCPWLANLYAHRRITTQHLECDNSEYERHTSCWSTPAHVFTSLHKFGIGRLRLLRCRLVTTMDRRVFWWAVLHKRGGQLYRNLAFSSHSVLESIGNSVFIVIFVWKEIYLAWFLFTKTSSTWSRRSNQSTWIIASAGTIEIDLNSSSPATMKERWVVERQPKRL